MKFTLSVAVLALAASQAMAVVPVPIKGCTKTVVVTPAQTCEYFGNMNMRALKNGCTFDDLLKWNTKLSPKCDNLDVNAAICVSVTAGAGGVTGNTTVPSAGPITTAKPPTTTAKATSASLPVTTAPSVPTSAKPSSANGNKASMALGAAGVLLSVVYML
ncbi:hypothetical protein BGZ98_009567 [Dissophora globulifera]|nr:hypothetical protein BGZ98_009567 [Dissophora globulifera]